MDQSSEQEVEDWNDILADTLTIFQKSPFGKRTKNFDRVIDLVAKWMGMNTDHCSKAKKTTCLVGEQKTDAVQQILGEKDMLDKSPEEADAELEKFRAKMIEDTGGIAAWNALDKNEQAIHIASMIKDAVKSIGESLFSDLSEEEQWELEFFIWAGCGCHKDMNSVLGGDTAMRAWWAKTNTPGPILLANRDNVVTLNNIQTPLENDAAIEHALNVTTRGGVKTASIAGAIFNHKDDKKGQQDTFRWWFKQSGIPINFPNTSSNRYGSYCAAAAVLLQYRDKFLTFLEFVHDKKDHRVFTNMERNLFNALQCKPTLTELATLALYAQAITHPYMCYIHGSNGMTANMLDLGPLHLEVEQHIDKVIANPDLLVSANSTYVTGAMDGKEWETPNAVAAILKLAPELPHLSDLVVEFFTGARGSWIRFTSEFTPGGLIDEATHLQKELAWMPATNDLNEGILGKFRTFMRGKPSTTLHMWNAQAMYQHNGTQKFMDSDFDEDDHKFVMQEARVRDASHLEPERKEKVIVYAQKKTEKKMEGVRENAKKKADNLIRLDAVTLILDKDVMGNTKGKKLQDQLDAFYHAGAPLPMKKQITKADQKRDALKVVIDIYNNNNGTWPEAAVAADIGLEIGRIQNDGDLHSDGE